MFTYYGMIIDASFWLEVMLEFEVILLVSMFKKNVIVSLA